MKALSSFLLLAVFAATATAIGGNPAETMCVKQKDGTYKCKASGKIEKEPCCATPTNPPVKKRKAEGEKLKTES